MQGKIVGANINMNSGAPGGGGQIQIRGVTSILGNSEPLFVVDASSLATRPSRSARTREQGVWCHDERDVGAGQPGEPARRCQPQRHRERSGPEERRGDGDLWIEGDQRRCDHHDERAARALPRSPSRSCSARIRRSSSLARAGSPTRRWEDGFGTAFANQYCPGSAETACLLRLPGALYGQRDLSYESSATISGAVRRPSISSR